MAASLGKSGEMDLFYRWIEEAVNLIREYGWSWNWTSKSRLTLKSVSEASGVTFTWTEGDSYITCSAPLVAITYSYTGRKVKLGDEWYRTTDIGKTNPARIYVDRGIKGSSTATTISLVRDEFSFPTTRLRTVEVDSLKLSRYSEAYKTRLFHGRFTFQQDVGLPRAYMESDNVRLPSPLFPPSVTGVNAVAWETTGKIIYYFYTIFDSETGLESAPGPTLKYTSVGFQPMVTYGNPVNADQLEGTSYSLRLYRSVADPNRVRCPMWSIQTRSPLATGLRDTFTGSWFYGKERHWDGSWSTIRLFSPPDDTVRTLYVEHLNNWSFRPHEEDLIELGTNDSMIELLRIYLTGLINLSTRTPEEYRKCLMAFRGQLNYLITVTRSSGNDDVGPETHNRDQPGTLGDDWVENLNWRN
jgi:hypothetical protein